MKQINQRYASNACVSSERCVCEGCEREREKTLFAQWKVFCFLSLFNFLCQDLYSFALMLVSIAAWRVDNVRNVCNEIELSAPQKRAIKIEDTMKWRKSAAELILSVSISITYTQTPQPIVYCVVCACVWCMCSLLGMCSSSLDFCTLSKCGIYVREFNIERLSSNTCNVRFAPKIYRHSQIRFIWNNEGCSCQWHIAW